MTHNWKKDTQTHTRNIISYCQFTQFKDLTLLSWKSHSGWPEIHTDKHTHKSFPSDRIVSQRCCILSLPQVQGNNIWIRAHRAGLFLVWMQGNLQASLSISPDSCLIASENRKHLGVDLLINVLKQMQVFQATLMSHFYEVFLQQVNERTVRNCPCERKNYLVYGNYSALLKALILTPKLSQSICFLEWFFFFQSWMSVCFLFKCKHMTVYIIYLIYIYILYDGIYYILYTVASYVQWRIQCTKTLCPVQKVQIWLRLPRFAVTRAA